MIVIWTLLLLLLLLRIDAVHSSLDEATTNYDDIAHQYHTIKGNPIKKYSEEYTVLQHLLFWLPQQEQNGNKNTKQQLQLGSLLDLACGDGHYTRLFHQHGLAKEIVGGDASDKMLQRAIDINNNSSTSNNSNSNNNQITYKLCNVLNDDDDGLLFLDRRTSFDLIVAIYLIPYATSRQDLEKMMHNIYNHVAPGGRFYTVLLNPNLTLQAVQVQKAYGADIIVAAENKNNDLLPSSWTDATKLQMKISHGPDFAVEFVNYYWTQATLEQVLQSVGFENISWLPMQLDPVGIKELGARFWEPYMQHPAIISMTCTKPLNPNHNNAATSAAAKDDDDDKEEL